jgi:hypothetical protein
MRAGAISLLGLGLGWLALASPAAPATENAPTEYQIKAAFLFNFAKFVQWPSAAFAERNSPLLIGVLGDDPFHGDLAGTIHNKSVDEHPLILKEVPSLVEATNCHILFICASEKKRLPQVLQALQRASVLTVSEMEGFTENGGMINFVLEGTKIHFQINQEAAARAGLKISSKLMSLARRPGSS